VSVDPKTIKSTDNLTQFLRFWELRMCNLSVKCTPGHYYFKTVILTKTFCVLSVWLFVNLNLRRSKLWQITRRTVCINKLYFVIFNNLTSAMMEMKISLRNLCFFPSPSRIVRRAPVLLMILDRRPRLAITFRSPDFLLDKLRKFFY
jgi:hypothetical protein